MKPDAVSVMSEVSEHFKEAVEERRYEIDDILASITPADQEFIYWCGYHDGMHGLSWNIDDPFPHDHPDYIVGVADGKGDLEILSNRTPK